ncbi:MAG: acetyltransferase [Bacteroidetes bacterium GWE2_42_24]|nr:MAG: acetyltransferase [Bacteroidetes bacterium GWE2_42_24]OFY32312.1 MAG: acetyltransferase [Bacteroidetes bacterium GWF2_43_11]PKP17386.1 MAG: acetyltransferase [Bacteroidetes bacterium HGW-Bacteroidetes-22]
MEIIQNIKSNPKLKRFVLLAMIPKNQARPRLWVKLFLNPFFHQKGKRSRICRNSRIDVLPFNNFCLGEDSTIEDFCTINNGVGDVLIGDRTRIGMSNVLIGPVTIGNDVIFAQNIVLSGLNHSYQDITIPIHKQGVSRQEITVEDEVWIGANCVVVAGVTIGKHSVIAAGSVVTKDVPPYSVVVGNPGRVIKQYSFDSNKWENIVRS